ncbi:NAD(P)H-binding protein [Psychrobacter faecalis]|jgi:nucleoside-diphosphate-sugar epimerase|uniref:NAD(P)H-binding protein n=1 Tax=Psychrobacter faecalis TaxID=180588 RepID=A0ABT9HH51_9GAMM|nr:MULTISPECIES: NAD(P)H-binding protein [Psychrobacter]MCG3860936.1 NAD(P)H-binding protein [Psychrobacter sp. Ps5]MDP4544997.1 NAD(P)H-binding protein [Psychrobacter faecalis]OAP70220.1 epimerase [Psychrobacter sp. SHUES1]PKG83232.1 epimerase [Psychrobacter sp. Sarcosine-02u-2]WLW66668.1 NAD(P)H-binding protein [Psychrobacter sp. van23A]
MKILVIGASGRVGSDLVKQLLADNHQVIGTTRQDEKLFSDNNYSQLDLDITAEKDAIQQQIKSDIDAVYFVAGSGGKDVLEVDLHGAVKTMQAVQDKGIKRYIMLSTVFSLDTSKWNQPGIADLKEYYISKHYADQWLVKNSSLDYTIVQAGALKERAGTGKIIINDDNAGENAIEDVAMTLAAVLNADNTIKKVFSMHNGETAIDAALAKL